MGHSLGSKAFKHVGISFPVQINATIGTLRGKPLSSLGVNVCPCPDQHGHQPAISSVLRLAPDCTSQVEVGMLCLA